MVQADCQRQIENHDLPRGETDSFLRAARKANYQLSDKCAHSSALRESLNGLCYLFASVLDTKSH